MRPNEADTAPDGRDDPSPAPSLLNSGFVVDLTKRLPQALVSRAWGWLARRRHPRVGVALLKRTFVAAVGIDLSEAGRSIGDYQTLEDLFVRQLKPGARRIEPQPDAVVSPVDGRVGEVGIVTDDTCLQVKGRSYRLSRLLDDADEAAGFEGGAYATIYLAPFDYHRIHSPVSGSISKVGIVPGALMPVFREALNRVDELFARNERLITYIDGTTAGRVAVVKVGATLVGRISLAYDDSIYTNVKGQLRNTIAYDPPRAIQKGAELGSFELGSTVIIVAERGHLTLEGLTAGAHIKMGQRIGTVVARSAAGKRAKARKQAT